MFKDGATRGSRRLSKFYLNNVLEGATKGSRRLSMFYLNNV